MNNCRTDSIRHSTKNHDRQSLTQLRVLCSSRRVGQVDSLTHDAVQIGQNHTQKDEKLIFKWVIREGQNPKCQGP